MKEATWFCGNCKEPILESEMATHTCKRHTENVCADHFDERIKHAERLLGFRPEVKTIYYQSCDQYDRDCGKPGAEWADGFHHEPCYEISWEGAKH